MDYTKQDMPKNIKGETLFEGMYNEKLKIFTDSLNAEPLY